MRITTILTRTRAPFLELLMAGAAAIWLGNCPAASIEYAISDGGKLIRQTASVSKDSLIVRAAGGDRDKDVIFDAKSDILFVVNHRNRSYFQIDNRTIDQAAAMMESIANTMASSRGVVAEIFGVPVGDSQTSSLASTIDSGRTLKVGGYPCQLHRTQIEATMVSEICIAEEKSLKLTAGDIKTLRAFFAFSNRLMLRAGTLLTVIGMELPRMTLDAASGLPIALYIAKHDREVRVTRINNAMDNTEPAAVPKEYTRAQIPFISG